LATAASPGAGEAANRFRETVNRLSYLYRTHIAAEDAHLIGLGREVLSAAELSAISREMKTRRNSLDAPHGLH
jgi:hypothetical protein